MYKVQNQSVARALTLHPRTGLASGINFAGSVGVKGVVGLASGINFAGSILKLQEFGGQSACVLVKIEGKRRNLTSSSRIFERVAQNCFCPKLPLLRILGCDSLGFMVLSEIS